MSEHNHSTTARPITRDRMKKKQPIQRTILIPASEEDNQRLEDARNALDRARLLEPDSVDELKAALQAVEAEVREEGLEFIFRGVGRRKFEELQRAHPPTDEQQAENGGNLAWNPDTFLPALLEATVVNSELTAKEWNDDVLDSDDWGQAEVGLLLQTALGVNRESRVASLGN